MIIVPFSLLAPRFLLLFQRRGTHEEGSQANPQGKVEA